MLSVARKELALFLAYLEVKGIAHSDKITADIAAQCGDKFNILWRVEISTKNVRVKNVMVIFIPEALTPREAVFVKSQGLRLAMGRFSPHRQHQPVMTKDDWAVFYQDH